MSFLNPFASISGTSTLPPTTTTPVPAATWYESFLGLTPTADGYIADNGLSLSNTSSTSSPTSTSSTPARGGCPSSWPDWACTAVNAISSISGNIPENAGHVASKALTGKDNGTTNDIVPHLLPNVQSYLISGSVLLAAVLVLALGVWTIVKD